VLTERNLCNVATDTAKTHMCRGACCPLVVVAATAIMIITIDNIVEVRVSLIKASRKKTVREAEETAPQGSLYTNNIKHDSRKIPETIRLPTNVVINLDISMNSVYLDQKQRTLFIKNKILFSSRYTILQTFKCHLVMSGMSGSTIYFHINS
jgi:hypothetical protein